MTTPLLEVEALSKTFVLPGRTPFARSAGAVRAVDGVSFKLPRQESLGIVGESGCGKSTTGRLVLRLIEPTAGRVLFEGQDILKLDANALRTMRRAMQIVFQDPQSSLDPRMTVEEIVLEPLLVQGARRDAKLKQRARELLELVGLSAAHAERYPHEFSGGQRQRIGIARAIAPQPKLIVCDEPVSALDVSVQAQIINLLQDLKDTLGLSYLFIAHDLAVVRHLCERIAVMYLGRIVEMAPAAALFASPLHPYTQTLLASIPAAHPRDRRTRPTPKGDVPSAMAPPPGCHFHTRCAFARPRCSAEVPALRTLASGRDVACHFAEELEEGP
ncbi:MAG: ATP-binding cassette domain-containing protein [Telmatospirillum sp.]|nr:ATP-binding cassette domain-containing protein [Telmatospirillum sp.]